MGAVITSFGDRDTERLWRTALARKIPANLRRVALRKLVLLDDAADLRDLSVPPGNRLEALHGDGEGQHSIRINEQYRICFVWRHGNAEAVEIVDYH